MNPQQYTLNLTAENINQIATALHVAISVSGLKDPNTTVMCMNLAELLKTAKPNDTNQSISDGNGPRLYTAPGSDVPEPI